MSSFRPGRHLCLFQMPEVNNKSMEQLTTRQENMMYKMIFIHCINIQVFIYAKKGYLYLSSNVQMQNQEKQKVYLSKIFNKIIE